MKSIIIFTSDLYQGGVAESTRKLAKLLYTESKVIVCTYDSLPTKKNLPKEVKVVQINCPLSSGFRKGKVSITINSILRYFCLPIAVIKFLALLLRYKPDVVYSMTYIPNLVSLFCSYLIKYKVVISERQDPREDLASNSLIGKFLRFFYPRADKVHANSEQMIDAIRDFYGLNLTHICHFDNFFFREELIRDGQQPVESEFFINKYTLITSGRLSKQKGQWHLLSILRYLRDKGIDVGLIILGDGELKEELECLVADYKLEGNVFLLGDVINPHKYVAKSDLFLFPSIWESFGNTLVEAMALGVPVASTVCRSGPGQIINFGEYGLNMGTFPSYGNGNIPSNHLAEICVRITAILEEKGKLYSEKSVEGYKRFDSSNISNKVLAALLE